MSDRNEKWKVLSSQRMTRILKTTELIANLSSHNYEFEDDWLEYLLKCHKQKGHEIRQIFEAKQLNSENRLSTEFVFPELPSNSKLSLKQTRFREIAQRRMSSLYKEMNYFSRLANTKNYTYDLMDVDYLFELYEAKSDELRKWFPPFKSERIDNEVNVSNYPTEN